MIGYSIGDGLRRQVLGNALDEVNDFHVAMSKEKHDSTKQMIEGVVHWCPPIQGVLKVNIDGAFDKVSRKGGIGLVVRDNLGQIVSMEAIPILNAASAELVEALGFKLALNMVINNLDKDYVFEGDAQDVVNMLRGSKNAKACLEVIIKDSLNLVRFFNSCSFNYVSRTCNRVADVIAKYALSLDLPTSWQGNFPHWVCREASLDVSQLK